MSNQRVRVTVEFDIDTERCRLYGVTPREVFQSLQADMSEEFDGATIYTNHHKLNTYSCLLYTSPSPRDRQKSRMPSSA